ncbi:MAG: hypothetical protein QOC99_359 [Acidobacteriota bacterium]|jgi:hypothetical protein|nr:hypothetical protein [Acidobacteriota bacterium]
MASNIENWKRRNSTPAPLAIGVALVALIVCVLMFSFAATRWLAARASRRWERVEGFVVESKLPACDYQCWPSVKYRFVAGGQEFTGEHIKAGPQDYYDESEAAAKVRLYALGRRVSVYFDPRDPMSSCLEPGVFRWSVYLFLLIGGSCLFVAVYLTQAVVRGKPLLLVKGGEPPAAVESYKLTPKG